MSALCHGDSCETAGFVLCRTEVEADLQFAADAAAHFSKARSEGRAEVVYALIKDLKKPRGARPGQVYRYFLPFHLQKCSSSDSAAEGDESLNVHQKNSLFCRGACLRTLTAQVLVTKERVIAARPGDCPAAQRSQRA